MTNATEDREVCLEQELPEPSVLEEVSDITLEMIDQAVKELWQELIFEINMLRDRS